MCFNCMFNYSLNLFIWVLDANNKGFYYFFSISSTKSKLNWKKKLEQLYEHVSVCLPVFNSLK